MFQTIFKIEQNQAADTKFNWYTFFVAQQKTH